LTLLLSRRAFGLISGTAFAITVSPIAAWTAEAQTTRIARVGILGVTPRDQVLTLYKGSS